MKRGRGQVLYRFLPEKIVDYSDTRSIGKVTHWRCKELKDLNRNRLIESVEMKRARFGTRVSGFPKSPDDYVILEPMAVEVDLFPLTFICQNQDCLSARRFDSVQNLRDETARYGYRCPRCKRGALEQNDFVHYHTCGEVESFVVRACPTHGYKWIVLNKNNSDSPKHWWWQCKECSASNPRNVARVGAHCNVCSGNPPMSHSPFRKSEVFYSQTLSSINAPSLENLVLTDSDRKMILAEFLGIVPRNRTKELLAGREHYVDKSDLQRKKEALVKQGLSPDHVEKVLKEFGLNDADEEIAKAVTALEIMLQLGENDYTVLSLQLMGYFEALGLPLTRSLEAVIDSLQGPAKERIRGTPTKLSYLGIKDAWITQDLPIVNVAFGYTRGDPTLTTSVLKAFPRNKDYQGKTPVYGIRIETEAAILELDRSKILAWLVDNNLAPSQVRQFNETEAKTWFLSNIRTASIPQYDAIPDSLTTTKAVYGLLHSLSHLFINKASGFSGLDKGSIREILFPNIPAFALFANTAQGYQLGGIVSLFENSMTYWLDRAGEDVNHCLYDPMCAADTGACHACLQLPENSCERFNLDLSRSWIIGREGEIPIVGYWE